MHAVVEVGPTTVRGPHAVPDGWAHAAVESVDDRIALLADRPVAVRQLWRDVLRSAASPDLDALTLVCPSWWHRARIDVVREAAAVVAAKVVVRQRSEVLRAAHPQPVAVVEVDGRLVAVSPAGDGPMAVVPRLGDDAAALEAVLGHVDPSTPVVVDGEGALAAGLVGRIRSAGGIALVAGPLPAPASETPRLPAPQLSVADNRRRTAVLAAVVALTAVLGAAAVIWDRGSAAPVDMPTTLLVEGRVGVQVPAQWRVERITAGPGSARVQVVSPTDSHTALHITQSPLAPRQTTAMIADGLRRALADQPPEVFVDFRPDGHRAGRSVVTYREVRPDHSVEWAVLTDHAVRIAVGCQSAPGRADSVRRACDTAVESAHAVF